MKVNVKDKVRIVKNNLYPTPSRLLDKVGEVFDIDDMFFFVEFPDGERYAAFPNEVKRCP